MRRHITITALVALLVAVPVFAQSPFPGGVRVGGGWVPCDHPIAVVAGVGCTAKVPTPTLSVPPPCVTIGTATVCSADQCRIGMVNPYEQDDLATACAHWTQRLYVPPPVPTYRLGQPVKHAYGMRAVVIGIARNLAGVEVLTLEITESHSNLRVGDVLAAVNNVGNPWLAVTRD